MDHLRRSTRQRSSNAATDGSLGRVRAAGCCLRGTATRRFSLIPVLAAKTGGFEAVSMGSGIVPDVEVPDVDEPDVEVPDVEVPDVEVPGVEVPGVATAKAVRAPVTADGLLMNTGADAGAVGTSFVSQPTTPNPSAPRMTMLGASQRRPRALRWGATDTDSSCKAP